MRAYVIFLKNGYGIKIDEDELPGIIKSLKNGEPVITKQNVFNPDQFVTISEDKDRVARRREYPEEAKELKEIFDRAKLSLI